jgi:transposase
MLKDKLPPFMGIHKASRFLQDGAPCHKTKKVMDWFKDQTIEVMDWPGNSPDLNPIENVWSYMKNKLRKRPSPRSLSSSRRS